MRAMRLNAPRRRLAFPVIVLLIGLASAAGYPAAQAPAQAAAKKALGVEDYTKWRTIADSAISGDGKWVTYTLQLSNTTPAESKPVLHLLNLDTDETVRVEHASGGMFSADSKWLAYQVDPGAAQRARAGRGRGGAGSSDAPAPQAPPAPDAPPAPPAPPAPSAPSAPQAPQAPQTGRGNNEIPPRRVELRNLATGQVQSWQDIGTFVFSPTSTHLVLKRRGAETPATGGGRGGGAPGGGGQGAGASSNSTPAGPRGTDAILFDLRTGRHQLLGSVADFAFNRQGDLLGYTVDAAIKDGNGLFVLDTRRGRITPLDNDAKHYTRLQWNDDGNALAVLKGLDVEKMREKNNVLLAFTDVPAAIGDEDIAPKPAILDPSKTEALPKEWVISDRAGLAWSEDNKRVFFGIKQQVAAPDSGPRKTTDEAAVP